MKTLAFLLSFCVIFAFVGCGRPAGMPATIPCKVILVNDGIPQADYDVSLRSVSGNALLSITARTDSSGVADFRTQYTDYIAKGAPEGTYKVLIDKRVELPPDGVDVSRLLQAERDAYGAKRAKEAEKLRVISVLLTKENSTPFEITLSKDGESQWTFDLKEYIKQK
jgi:hypothetical protein